MLNKENIKPLNKKNRPLFYLIIALGFIIIFIILFQTFNPNPRKTVTRSLNIQDSLQNSENNSVKNNNDQILAQGEGIELVKANCTSCHSTRLITQNRATREGWLNMIRWMQQTQNLWDLGENEEIILNYLSTHYAPEEKGRRENLKDIEWYELKMSE